MTGVVSVDGCWQRGMTWAGGLAGLGLVSVGRRGWAWSAGVDVGGVLSVSGHWVQGLVWAGVGRHGQQGWAWEAYSVWVGVGGKGWCGQHGWVGAGGLSSGQRFN